MDLSEEELKNQCSVIGAEYKTIECGGLMQFANVPDIGAEIQFCYMRGNRFFFRDRDSKRLVLNVTKGKWASKLRKVLKRGKWYSVSFNKDGGPAA